MQITYFTPEAMKVKEKDAQKLLNAGRTLNSKLNQHRQRLNNLVSCVQIRLYDHGNSEISSINIEELGKNKDYPTLLVIIQYTMIMNQ